MNLVATKKKALDPQLRAYIAESVREVLDDPDFGLELSAAAKRRLKEAQTSVGKGIPLATILKKYT
ncbi:MAG: hypothetical protein NT108_03620 [Candidatus Kaiserbacteria bacterium]|nr:hypothetical protein [Candidatus Kaiserbacteria bacterium]